MCQHRRQPSHMTLFCTHSNCRPRFVSCCFVELGSVESPVWGAEFNINKFSVSISFFFLAPFLLFLPWWMELRAQAILPGPVSRTALNRYHLWLFESIIHQCYQQRLLQTSSSELHKGPAVPPNVHTVLATYQSRHVAISHWSLSIETRYTLMIAQ